MAKENPKQFLRDTCKAFSDKELLLLMGNGRMDAFEQIYARYAGDMLLYAINVLGKKEICEDLIQNIFLNLWLKRNTIVITNLSGYLFKAVKYQIFNHLRNQKISFENLKRLDIIDISMNISKSMEYDELEKAVKNCVTQLPKRCRQIFVLSRYQYKTNKEIAEELGISIQAVKNQISKALSTIRHDLQDDELAFFILFFY
ncbi:RNA polymerase sigma-70 factor [Maribacter sp. 2304DJ31-5]|uniref:RNA polymerase sigma-70 factor n=1 Tax=Maribacter sp. 2304DJ31-5 TaxID=3386273 RepID=UPI0039BD5982